MEAKALTRGGIALAKCSAERAKKDLERFNPSIGDEKGNEFLKHPDDAMSRDLELDVVDKTPCRTAKLIELVHNICLHEIKLCSAAAKEFVKLLKGETGGNLLRLYFHNSPNFAELLQAWKLRHDRKQGASYIFKLIQTILIHPEGKGTSTAIKTAIDRFARLLIRQKMDDIYKALNSNQGKQQNAALLLLASIVRRGQGIASEVAGKFKDFKGFAKLGAYKTQGARKLTKHYSTRRAFVAFAISFIQVGFLGFVFRHKEMYSLVLHGLGEDSEDTVASVLTTLKDKILVKDSSIPPLRRSVLFGIKTLKQLASISAREDGGIANELAHDVLLEVCTDPCNGLMPDANRNLEGHPKRLLELMKSLRATEFCYHLDLLLAIVRGRPSFASAFLDEFPYNVENLASPSWFSSISLAANLVSSVRTPCSFGFLSSDQTPSAGSDVQTIMKCICPRPFRRSLFNKGMPHSDLLVRHGTLRFLLETLRLLDSFVSAWKLCSSHSCSAEQIQASLERDVMGEVRSFFPDLETLKKSLRGTTELSCKRKAVLDSELEGRKKRFKNDVLEEDIVIGGVTFDKDIFLAEGPVMADQADAEKDFLGIVSEILGSEFCSKPIDSVEEAEMCFNIKLLEVLRIYVRFVPSGIERSFEFFVDLLKSSSGFPSEFRRTLLSLLNECISWTPKSQIERIPTKMLDHLDVFMNLLLDDEVKDLAYDLALVAMSSTGAFDKNPSEIGAWFRFLPAVDKIKRPLKIQEAVQSVGIIIISLII